MCALILNGKFQHYCVEKERKNVLFLFFFIEKRKSTQAAKLPEIRLRAVQQIKQFPAESCHWDWQFTKRKTQM